MSVKRMRTLLSLATEQGINIKKMSVCEFAHFSKSMKLYQSKG